MNIYKRKDGRWEGRMSRGKSSNGKRKYKAVFGKTKEEVSKKMAKIRRVDRLLLFICHRIPPRR